MYNEIPGTQNDPRVPRSGRNSLIHSAYFERYSFTRTFRAVFSELM
jgi:hypothetical protein